MRKFIRHSAAEHAIMNKIHILRGEKVMMDSDLAKLYGVSTGNLNKAVKRNLERFPKDFMFRISDKEYDSLRFQIGILEKGKHSKYLPYAFTEQGVAMLSSVLRSKSAISVNIQIMRVYTKIRRFLSTQKDILLKLEQMERKTVSHDEKIELIFEYIKRLIQENTPPRKRIGYQIAGEE